MSKTYQALCVLILVFISTMVRGQNYFNKRYDLTNEGLWDFTTTILSINDGFLLGSETGSQDNYDRRRIVIGKIGFDGDLVWMKVFGDSVSGYGGGYPGYFIRTVDTNYALVGFKRDPYPGWIRDNGLLMKLNDNLDSIWTRLYGDVVEPCDSEFLFRQVIEIPKEKFVILGGMMYSSEQRPHFYLLKTDSVGNKMWEKFIGDPPDHYFPYSIAATSDNGFILGGSIWSGSMETVDPIVFKTDSIGNVEWDANFGSDFLDNPAFVNTSYDGFILVGTIVSDSAITYDHYYGRKTIVKMDNEGTEIWKKKYGTAFLDNELWSIRSLDDGRIITTGSRKTFYPAWPERLGWIFCTDANGDSLWYREYTFLNAQYSINHLYDVIPTMDDGFISCGYVYPVQPDTGTQDTWIIKVDSIGCEAPDQCWVGVPEKEISLVEKKILIYPNPASEIANIEIPTGLSRKNAILNILDIYGRNMYMNASISNSPVIKINVSSWPPGLYMARLVFMNEVVGKARFVVQQ